MISMDKKYRTRDGREVRLLCVDRKGEYPVIGLIDDIIVTWTAQYAADLIEVMPEVVRWVNVYPTAAMAVVYETREYAERRSGPNRIAILKVTTKNGGLNGAEDVSVEVIPVGVP